jgi:hypothetical protein
MLVFTFVSTFIYAQVEQTESFPNTAVQDSSAITVPPDSLKTEKQLEALKEASLNKSQSDSTKTAKIDTIKYFIKETVKPMIGSLYFDSTLVRGSAYGSFGDIFDRLPGTFYFDYGSVGQLATGSLFAGIGEKFVLTYDGLVLNDLLNGYADLNLIPTESIQHIDVPVTQHRRSDVFSPLGQTLQLTSHQMAHLPIRSRVAYRTGKNGYDDIDVRLGVQASPRFAVNAGAVLKNYAGTSHYSKYRAQKINLKLDRYLNPAWSIHYLMLYNISDLNSPVFSVYNINYLHQKDSRFDHGFILKNGRSFSAVIQYTRLHRELYNPFRSRFDELHEADQIRVSPQWHTMAGRLQIAAGALYHSIRLKKSQWGTHRQSQTGFYLNLSQQSCRLAWLVGGQIKNEKGWLQPELSVSYALRDSINLFMWALHRDLAPPVQALYADNVFEKGDAHLKNESSADYALGFERIGKKVSLFSSVGYSSLHNAIFPSFQSQEPGFAYQNLPAHYFFSADLTTNWQLFDWLLILTKAKYIKQQHNFTWPNLPAVFACGYVQIHKILFQNDLNMYLRLGFSTMDSREESWSVSAQGSQSLKPFFVPYVHGIFHIKDVTLFAAFQNVLGIDYQRMTDYPMPSALFRWGLVWNFLD